ncbi:hypothetical protein MRY87_12790 [bacterium]|nr:hypothetical protein [bacterium]
MIWRILTALLLALPALAHGAPQLGTLRVRVADNFTSNRKETLYLLRTSRNAHVELPSSLFENIEVVPGGTYSYDSEEGTLSLRDEDRLQDQALTEHTVLTLRVHFQDREVSCGDTAIANTLRDTKRNVSDWFLTSSYDTDFFSFDHDNDGSVDIASITINAASSDSCDYQQWADQADAMAALQGVSVDEYSHVIYVLPSGLSCDWGGLAEFDCGSDCRAWIASCDARSIYTHELGHNLGVDHATSDSDGDGMGDDEYGDASCPMGTAAVGLREFNVPHKVQLGWLSSAHMSGISEDTFVSLAAAEQPLAEDEDSFRAVRVLVKPTQPTLGRYYFSFRSKQGDFSAALRKEYADKLNVHSSQDLLGRTTYLKSLGVDESWTDEEGRRVTLADVDGGYATVWVSPTGTVQPRYTVTGTIEEKKGRSLSPKIFKKLRVVIKKVSSKEKIVVRPDSSGAFSASLTYGKYRFRLRRKKRAPVKRVTKPFIQLISQDESLSLTVKKRR